MIKTLAIKKRYEAILPVLDEQGVFANLSWQCSEMKPTNTDYPFEAIVQPLILTIQRRVEMAGMQQRILILIAPYRRSPPAEQKIPAPTLSPLGSQVLQILAIVPRTDSPFVFPARDKPEAVFNGWSKYKRRLDKQVDIENGNLHDLRHTAAIQSLKYLSILSQAFPNIKSSNMNSTMQRKAQQVSSIGDYYEITGVFLPSEAISLSA